MVAFSKQLPGQELGAPVVLGSNAPKGAPVVDPQQFLKLATMVQGRKHHQEGQALNASCTADAWQGCCGD